MIISYRVTCNTTLEIKQTGSNSTNLKENISSIIDRRKARYLRAHNVGIACLKKVYVAFDAPLNAKSKTVPRFWVEGSLETLPMLPIMGRVAEWLERLTATRNIVCSRRTLGS